MVSDKKSTAEFLDLLTTDDGMSSSHLLFPVLKPQCLILSFYCFSEKREKGNKCRRRSLLLQKAVSELPASKRRQTIIVGEMKGSLCEVTFQ